MNARVISDDELWEFYYDAMELVEIGDLPEAEELLRQALTLDPSFVAAHVGMVAVYQEGGFTKGVREFTESGYAEIKKRFKKLPSSLTWGDIDSRQYLRAICNMAA